MVVPVNGILNLSLLAKPNKFIKKLKQASPNFGELFEKIAAKRENALFSNMVCL